MLELPEINGEINVTIRRLENGVQYIFELKGGDIIGISLDLLRMADPNLVRVSGNYAIIGQIGLNILGYRDGALICRVASIGDSE